MASSMIPWDFELKEGEKITKILIEHGFVVNGIGFEITDKDGKVREPKWYEGTEHESHDDPHEIMKIPLDDDFVTHIDGTYGEHKEEICITTINIHTDLRPEGHGQCGKFKEPSEVNHFSSPLPTVGSIFSYFGTTGKFLGSIGFVTLGNKTITNGPYGDDKSDLNWFIKLKKDELISKLTIKHAFLVDGFVFEVKNTTTGNTYIQEFSGPENNQDSITLEDHEVITKIDGVFGDYKNEGIKIALIKIFTNIHTEGFEYGNLDDVKNTKDFSYEVPPNSSIVGFCGSYERFLNSIGIIEETMEEHIYGPYPKPA